MERLTDEKLARRGLLPGELDKEMLTQNLAAAEAECNTLNARLIECMDTRSRTKASLKAEVDELKEKLAENVITEHGLILDADADRLEANVNRDALREKLAAAEACGYALISWMNWWDALSAEVPKVRRRDNWTAIMERYDALVRVQLKQAIDDWRETH